MSSTDLMEFLNTFKDTIEKTMVNVEKNINNKI